MKFQYSIPRVKITDKLHKNTEQSYKPISKPETSYKYLFVITHNNIQRKTRINNRNEQQNIKKNHRNASS